MEISSLAGVLVASIPAAVGVWKVGVDLLHFAFGPETAEVAELSFHFSGIEKWFDCDSCVT